MLDSWRRVKASELEQEGSIRVEDGNHGEYRPRRNEFGSGDTYFVRAADLSGNRIDFQSADRIENSAVDRIRKGVGSPGDVIFSHKGTVGKVALAPSDAPPFVCSPQTTFWRSLDPATLDQRYLYYFIQSRFFRQQWKRRFRETDMAPYISLTNQRDLEIIIPPLSIQQSIAHVLGILDDKIDLNRETNRALEATARAVFRSWFVDVDPVVAKKDGREPFGMDAETAALFPDRLVDSAVGPIPDGWEINAIGDAVEVVGGSTPSTRNSAYWDGGDIHWATPKDLSDACTHVLLDTSRKITPAGLEKISSGRLPRGTVLLSSRAPIGYLAIAELPTAVNQGFIAMKCGDRMPSQYVLHWTRENLPEIKRRAGGTTFAEISKRAFRPIPMVIPPAPLLEKFQRYAGLLHDAVVHNHRESQTLASLRDLLLPKLLSGEIRVPEAAEMAEAPV